MPLDPAIRDLVLRTPPDRDLAAMPIVTTQVLADPENAVEFVPYLARRDSPVYSNALRLLCLFDRAAVPGLAGALAEHNELVRQEGLGVIWSILFLESPQVVRHSLAEAWPNLTKLLGDQRPLVDAMPPHIERDFRGRVGDAAYIVVRGLLDREFDQSEFRAMTPDERDREVTTLIRNGPGALGVA
jgi:hypothetical protein